MSTKIHTIQMGAVWVASDGVRQCVRRTEEEAKQALSDKLAEREKWLNLQTTPRHEHGE